MAVNVIGSIKFKRRAAGAAIGAPSALLSGEPAYNENDDTLYLGYGDDGNGNATSAKAIAGAGAFATKQYVADAMADAGLGTVTSVGLDAPSGFSVSGSPVTGSGDLKFTWSSGYRAYTNAEAEKLAGIAEGANNYVHPTGDGNRHVPAIPSGDTNKFLQAAATAGAAPVWTALASVATSGSYNDLENKPTLGALAGKSEAAIADVSGLQSALDAKAPLDGPGFTGTPTAPTATAATNNTQIATTAFVKSAIAALIDGAGETLDTLKELADALGNDPNFAATITNEIGRRLAKANNLSDLADLEAARGNLGLGSLARQNANDVNITGGSIDNVVFDGGTF